jgi:hypothetical protein
LSRCDNDATGSGGTSGRHTVDTLRHQPTLACAEFILCDTTLQVTRFFGKGLRRGTRRYWSQRDQFYLPVAQRDQCYLSGRNPGPGALGG